MLTPDELKQIREIVKGENIESEERVKKYVNEQLEDAVDVLSGLIHSGYRVHEERIKKIEDELNIQHPKKN